MLARAPQTVDYYDEARRLESRYSGQLLFIGVADGSGEFELRPTQTFTEPFKAAVRRDRIATVLRTTKGIGNQFDDEIIDEIAHRILQAEDE